MKKTFAFIVINLALCGFAFAKSPLAEFEKAKEIKLLQSTREDVKRILAGYEHDVDEDEEYKQNFSTENAEIVVSFARGDCSDEQEYWNVAEWIVTKVEIDPEKDVEIKNLKFDFSNFTKELDDEEFPEDYFYHNEHLGIALRIEESKIEEIILFPSKSSSFLLCGNEKTKKLFSNEKRLVDFILEDRDVICGNLPPTTESVTLSATEIIIGCNKTAENLGCEDSSRKISITTAATDPENDVITYNYIISGGKIVGNGAEVIWDLTGVEPGTYTITVNADDGCGICGPTKTETVVIKECADCAMK